MVPLLQYLEFLNLSLATLSVGTGLILGAFVGFELPTIDLRSRWQS